VFFASLAGKYLGRIVAEKISDVPACDPTARRGCRVPDASCALPRHRRLQDRGDAGLEIDSKSGSWRRWHVLSLLAQGAASCPSRHLYPRIARAKSATVGERADRQSIQREIDEIIPPCSSVRGAPARVQDHPGASGRIWAGRSDL
jgi:hypothetical protein